MRLTSTNINDCFVVEGDRFHDNRGFFQRLHSELQPFDCLDQGWKQINHSQSEPGVLRGIHWAPYRKLVTCVQGRIYDVAVDLRRESSTYLQISSIWLDADSPNQFLIPSGCGHGFYASEKSVVIYVQDSVWRPKLEKDWHWKSFGIDWPNDKVILSEKDERAPYYER